MTTSNTLEGWEPVDATHYARPVQDEDATLGLCGAEMPDGRGILVWPNGGNARFAVVSSPADFLVDDVVPSADMGTIVGGSVRHTSVYTIDDQVYASVDSWDGSTWSLRIYSVDDPSLPTLTWTLESTVLSTLTPGTIFGNFVVTGGAGIPIRLDTGRWVLAQFGGEVGASGGWAASGTFAHAFYSDNGAAGPWVRTQSWGHYVSGFTRTDNVSSQIGRNPANGDLYWTSYASSPNEANVWRSTNNGTSWTRNNASNGWPGLRVNMAIDNETVLYAMCDTGVIRTPTGNPLDVDENLPVEWTPVASWFVSGMSVNFNSMKMIIAGNEVYCFVYDQVVFVGDGTSPAWHFNVHWST